MEGYFLTIKLNEFLFVFIINKIYNQGGIYNNMMIHIFNFIKNIFNKVLRKDGGDNLNKNEISEVNTKYTENNKFSKNKFAKSSVSFNDNSQNNNNSNNQNIITNNTYNITVNKFYVNVIDTESLNKKDIEEAIKEVLCNDDIIKTKKVVFTETTQHKYNPT